MFGISRVLFNVPFFVACLFSAMLMAETPTLTTKSFKTTLYSPVQKLFLDKTFSIQPVSTKRIPSIIQPLQLYIFAEAKKYQRLNLVALLVGEKPLMYSPIKTVNTKAYSKPVPKLPDAFLEKLNTRLSIEDIRELLNRSR